MTIKVTKDVQDSSPEYTITLNHSEICKLMGLLILVHNTGANMTKEDKAYCRRFDDEIMEARQSGPVAH